MYPTPLMKVAQSLQGHIGFQDLIFSLKISNDWLSLMFSGRSFHNLTPKTWREFKPNESVLPLFDLKYLSVLSVGPIYLLTSNTSFKRIGSKFYWALYISIINKWMLWIWFAQPPSLTRRSSKLISGSLYKIFKAFFCTLSILFWISLLWNIHIKGA